MLLERSGRKLTVSTHQAVMPLPSLKLLKLTPGPTSGISSFAFFSSPPDAARTMRALEVIITRRCLRFDVFPPKNLENFFGVSPPASPFPLGLCGCEVTVTLRFPSFRIRSLFLVRTGDQSISSCEGGGNSVMTRGFGRDWLLDAGVEADGPLPVQLVINRKWSAVCRHTVETNGLL